MMDARIPWILFAVASCVAAVSVVTLLIDDDPSPGDSNDDLQLTAADVLDKVWAQMLGGTSTPTPVSDFRGGGCQVAGYGELIKRLGR